jgi:uncharacterized lipoprotein YddW (UPF0748 family)
MIAQAALLVLALASGSSGCRYFWLSADGLESRASIDSLMEAAEDAGANGVIVQVAGRGEAWYRSSVLPGAPVTDQYDPLAIVIDAALVSGMEVHAWVNAFLTWSAPWEPRDRTHVYHAHPEWFICDLGGRSSRSYTRDECDDAGIVGATLSPAVPGVRARLAAICSELAAEYPVDGIHLDYIRYPGSSFGFEGPARAGFFLETGVDPVDLFPSDGRSAAGAREYGDAWRDFRARQVTDAVRTVRAELRRVAPEVMLSAAVMADPLSAFEDYGCDWRSWLEQGLVDFAAPMAYTTSPSRARELATLGTAGQPGRIVHGIAVYNQPLSTSLSGASEALERGAAGVCVYSLNTFDPGDSPTLATFWGSGDAEHAPDPAVFHRLARWYR